MRYVIALVLLIFPIIASPDISIDRYKFEWVVTEYDGLELALDKNENRTVFVLRQKSLMGVSIRFSAENAERLASILGNAREVRERGDEERMPAGSLHVTPRESELHGFRLILARAEQFSMSDRIPLTVHQAEHFAPWLARGQELADYVDRVIAP